MGFTQDERRADKRLLWVIQWCKEKGINLKKTRLDSELDQKLCTDLVQVGGKNHGRKIGFRCRKYSDLKYSGEITFRAFRASGSLTETDKMVSPLTADGVLYAFEPFSDLDRDSVYKLTYIDIAAMRDRLCEHLLNVRTILNKDGATGFKCLDLTLPWVAPHVKALIR
jgi:hypothetical protein